MANRTTREVVETNNTDGNVNESKSSSSFDWTPFIWVAAAIIFLIFLIAWVFPRINLWTTVPAPKQTQSPTIQVPSKIDVNVKESTPSTK